MKAVGIKITRRHLRTLARLELRTAKISNWPITAHDTMLTTANYR